MDNIILSEEEIFETIECVNILTNYYGEPSCFFSTIPEEEIIDFIKKYPDLHKKYYGFREYIKNLLEAHNCKDTSLFMCSFKGEEKHFVWLVGRGTFRDNKGIEQTINFMHDFRDINEEVYSKNHIFYFFDSNIDIQEINLNEDFTEKIISFTARTFNGAKINFTLVKYNLNSMDKLKSWLLSEINNYYVAEKIRSAVFDNNGLLLTHFEKDNCIYYKDLITLDWVGFSKTRNLNILRNNIRYILKDCKKEKIKEIYKKVLKEKQFYKYEDRVNVALSFIFSPIFDVNKI